MTSRLLSPAGPIVQRCFVGVVLIGLSLCAGLSGCERMAPRHQFYEKTPPMVFKRAEKHGERDFVHHWRTKVYTRLKADPAGGSDDQRAALKKYGQPDYTRHFIAQQRERVTEWIFKDSQTLAQFVEGDLAYTGPFTDYEKLLIDRGYPNALERVQGRRGPERLMAVYWNWFHTKSQIYSFSDGLLVGMHE